MKNLCLFSWTSPAGPNRARSMCEVHGSKPSSCTELGGNLLIAGCPPLCFEFRSTCAAFRARNPSSHQSTYTHPSEGTDLLRIVPSREYQFFGGVRRWRPSESPC